MELNFMESSHNFDKFIDLLQTIKLFNRDEEDEEEVLILDDQDDYAGSLTPEDMLAPAPAVPDTGNTDTDYVEPVQPAPEPEPQPDTGSGGEEFLTPDSEELVFG